MEPFDLNLRHLRALVAVLQHGSISRAAELVALSQPAVTQAIAKLETLAGMPLFERRTSGMAATAGGIVLAARAEATLARLAHGFQSIQKSGGRGFSRPDRLATMSQVRALLALADGGSYVAAARATGLAQPSLHRGVRELERLCGIALVERRGRGLAINPNGLRLVRAFRLAIGEIDSGIEELAILAGHDRGSVRIGAMPLARARVLPLAIARFHPQHPQVTVEIVEGSHGELIRRLREGYLDFLIGALRSPNPGPDVEQELLFEDRLIVVAGGAHPLARVERPTIEQLAAFPWVIARLGAPLREQWEGIFRDGGVPPPAAPVICGSVTAIRTLLIESEFLTLLSAEQVRVELAAGMLVGLGSPLKQPRRAIALTTRAEWRPTPTQTAFLDTLRLSIVKPTLQEIQ